MNIIYKIIAIYQQPLFLLQDFKDKGHFIDCANKIVLHKFNFFPSFLRSRPVKKLSWNLYLH